MKEKKNNNKQSKNIEKETKEKKTLSKKAKVWISIGTALVFVVACVGTLLAVLLSPKLKWHGLSVANFESYTSIGAASFGEGREATAVAYASGGAADKTDMKLAGITKDDMCREIEFENDKGKIVKQKAHLILFYAYENFTFLGFSTNKNKEFIEVENLAGFRLSNASDEYICFDYPYADEEKQIDWDKSCFLFVLDNKTGKIYDIREIFNAVEKFFDLSNVEYIDMQIANLGSAGGYSTGVEEFVNQEDLIFNVTKYDEKNTRPQSMVSIEFEENNIKVIEKMNSTQYSNFVGYDSSSLRYDKYGNIIIISTFSGLKYQKTNGQFVTDTTENAKFKFGFNNILYKHVNGTPSKTYYLNEQGEFEEIDFVFENVIETFKFCVKRDNLIFATLYDFTYQNEKIELLRITLDDENDWNYTVERETIMNSAGYSTEIKGKFVFLFSTNVLMKYNIETKELTSYESEYTFKKLKYYDNTDIIKFKAVDNSTMLEVDGYFDENGAIHIGDFAGVKKGNNRVYVVKPLN